MTSRVLLRWLGGKGRLSKWIIDNMPAHHAYTEVYGGGGSVLLRKPPCYAEVYNDLDLDVVTLFRVLRDPAMAERLISDLRLTPWSRTEWVEAYEPTDDLVERSRRLVIRSHMGFGSTGSNPDVKTGFRASTGRSRTLPAHDWSSYPDVLLDVVLRLERVIIENRPALEVLSQHDTPETLHYVDPPYMPETRSKKSRKGGERYHVYRYEMSEADHLALLDHLLGLSGMVMLSGYPNDLYDSRLKGWMRLEKAATSDGAHKRTEVLWINPPAVAATPVVQGILL